MRYSLQGVLALSCTCTPLRSLVIQELCRLWKQVRGAMRNPVNAQRLDVVPFLFLTKLASSAYRQWRRTGASESGHDGSQQSGHDRLF